MNEITLTGASIVTPEGIVERAALVVAEGRIKAIGASCGAPEVTLGGGYLVPGFIDIQVNGGGGVLFNDSVNVEAISTIAAAHLRCGTTTLMPTLISESDELITQAIMAIDAAIEAGVPGVVGLHIEGPYLNPARRGIHDATMIRPISDRAIEVLSASGLGKRMVTIAPEMAPAGTVARLREKGLIVCAGHSMANFEQTRAAIDQGLDGFTHLFNAMTQLGSREPGMVGAALDDRRSRFGLIADGHHVHPATMKIALAARGLDGVMLVTDAMPPVGTEPAAFHLGPVEVTPIDGRLIGPDGTLAGSLLDMGTAFRNAVTMLGLDLVGAARITSTNAAAFLGLAHERGAIAKGLRADLVHLDENLNVRSVWLGGERQDG